MVVILYVVVIFVRVVEVGVVVAVEALVVSFDVVLMLLELVEKVFVNLKIFIELIGVLLDTNVLVIL